MSKIIVFTVSDGQVTADARGFTGTACEAATALYTAGLAAGAQPTKRVKKPEHAIRTSTSAKLEARR